eukprot:UN08016
MMSCSFIHHSLSCFSCFKMESLFSLIHLPFAFATFFDVLCRFLLYPFC